MNGSIFSLFSRIMSKHMTFLSLYVSPRIKTLATWCDVSRGGERGDHHGRDTGICHTSGLVMSDTWEGVESAMTTIAEGLTEFSSPNSLCLNADKTQTLFINHPASLNSTSVDLLGISVAKNLGLVLGSLGQSGSLNRRAVTKPGQTMMEGPRSCSMIWKDCKKRREKIRWTDLSDQSRRSTKSWSTNQPSRPGRP